MTTEEFPKHIAELVQLAEKFEEHRPRLLGMLEHRMDPALRTRLAPADILSEAFLRVKDRWHDFQQSGMPAYLWLRRVVLDCLYDKCDFHRAQVRDVRAERRLPEGSASQMAIGLMSTRTSPSGALKRKELQERVRQVLELLDTDDQEVLCLHHFDQLSFGEVALELGIREGTARQRHARARLRFVELWSKLFGTEGLSNA